MNRVLLALLILAVVAALILGRCGSPATSRADRPAVDLKPDVPVAAPPRSEPSAARTTDSPDLLEAPPDPVVGGPCALFLVVTDEDSGEPITTDVDLYRLAVPSDEYWTQGDRHQVKVTVPREGVWIRDLPAAAYRIVAHNQRFDAEDPAPFGVAGDETRVSLALPMPREYDAFLLVRDAVGELVHEGGVRGGGLRYSFRSAPPEWLTERKLREPDRYQVSLGVGGGAGGGYGSSYSSSTETADGYRLRPWRQSTKRATRRANWTWVKQGWTDVALTVRHDAAGDAHLVGVTRPRQPILDSILLPDGARAAEAGANITTVCYAIQVNADTPRDAWRDCKTRVLVALDGYATLDFELALGEQPIIRTLVPK